MTNLGRDAALQLPVQKNYKIIKEKKNEKNICLVSQNLLL